MVQLFRTLITLLSVTAFALGTAITIQQDVANLSTSVTTFDNEIKAYPTSGGTLSAALAIHNTIMSTSTNVATCASDTAATPSLTLAEATAIVNAVMKIKPTILKALKELSSKKGEFESLTGDVISLMRADLNSLSGNVDKFGANFLKICPSSLVPSVTSVQNEIDVAFQAAITTYST